MVDDFEVLGKVQNIEVIEVNLSICELQKLKSKFGGRRWRKLKGIGLIRLADEGVH